MEDMLELRCGGTYQRKTSGSGSRTCNRLLLKVSAISNVVVEAHCPRCGEITVARIEDASETED